MSVAPVARAAAGAAGRGAGTAAVGRKATAKAGTAAKGTASARGEQLLSEGRSRKEAARAVRDEFGSTLSEAEGLLPPADKPAVPPADPPAATGRTTGPSLPAVPRSVRQAADVGGGVIIGAFTYVLVLTYLRDGMPGVRRWMTAKFLNRVDS